MQGLELLKRLPENIKERIIIKYGSLEKYYEFVFKLYELDRHWFAVKTELGRTNRQKILTQIFDLEDELESFGLDDGQVVLSEISGDHGDKVLAEFLKKLNH